MRDFAGLLKIAGIEKSAVKLPPSVVESLVVNGLPALGRLPKSQMYVSIPGFQRYLTRAQFKRLARQVASIRREHNVSKEPISRIISSRDMAAQRAAARARKSIDFRNRNLSAIKNSGFGYAGTTYSGYDIYDMPFSPESRLGLRRLVDAQYGAKRNPWCIIQRDGPALGKDLGMSGSSAYHWSELQTPSSGRFRVAVQPSSGKLVAIENPDVGSAAYPSWQSLSNHSFVNISDAASARSPADYGSFRDKLLLGYETGPGGKLYPRFNKGSRSGSTASLDSWRFPDSIDTGVEVL